MRVVTPTRLRAWADNAKSDKRRGRRDDEQSQVRVFGGDSIIYGQNTKKTQTVWPKTERKRERDKKEREKLHKW